MSVFSYIHYFENKKLGLLAVYEVISLENAFFVLTNIYTVFFTANCRKKTAASVDEAAVMCDIPGICCLVIFF